MLASGFHERIQHRSRQNSRLCEEKKHTIAKKQADKTNMQNTPAIAHMLLLLVVFFLGNHFCLADFSGSSFLHALLFLQPPFYASSIPFFSFSLSFFFTLSLRLKIVIDPRHACLSADDHDLIYDPTEDEQPPSMMTSAPSTL